MQMNPSNPDLSKFTDAELELLCISCLSAQATDDFNEMCSECRTQHEAERECDDYEGDGVFADNY